MLRTRAVFCYYTHTRINNPINQRLHVFIIWQMLKFAKAIWVYLPKTRSETDCLWIFIICTYTFLYNHQWYTPYSMQDLIENNKYFRCKICLKIAIGIYVDWNSTYTAISDSTRFWEKVSIYEIENFKRHKKFDQI